VAFVAFLLTFLSQCIDYGKIRGSQKLSQIIVPQCTKKMSGLWNLGLWMFAFYFIWKSIQYLLDLRRLKNTRDFYLYLLNIPDQDMQTITWQEVVARIMTLRDINPKTASTLTRAQRRWLGDGQSKERLDASDIANRLMRRENYLIALVNKDILNLTIPLPFLRNRQLFSRTMEWILMFSILDFVFDDRGQVNQEFLKSERRGELSLKLRGRFVFAGLMVLILSPFLAGYLLIVYFLMYYHVSWKSHSIPGRNPAHLLTLIPGNSKKSVRLVVTDIHTPCRVEIPRIQRTAPSLSETARHVPSVCKPLHRPVPQGQDGNACADRSVYLWRARHGARDCVRGRPRVIPGFRNHP
jgi:autophagy-related protein 9